MKAGIWYCTRWNAMKEEYTPDLNLLQEWEIDGIYENFLS